jgi:excisionase family DNA binding protein
MLTGADDRLISVKEAATECGRNPETVRRWIWNGKLPAEKLGNQLFIRRSELTRFFRGAGEAAGQAPVNVAAKEDFLERAIALQERMKARGVEAFDAADLVRRMREERTNQLEQGMH